MSRLLYLGTDPSYYITEHELVHYPVIRLIHRPFPINLKDNATHILFTSKNAVRFFFDQCEPKPNQKLIAIGKVTARTLVEKGFPPFIVAKDETQEGLIALLELENLEGSSFFYPRSSEARPLLADYFKRRGILCAVWDLYDPVFQKPEPVPDLEKFDAVVFTSPSTVRGFFKIFSKLSIPAITIGPITKRALEGYPSL